jgi:hypothetical protein
MKLTWYVATLLLACRIENYNETPVSCFEQIHLIKAKDGENAYVKSLKLGRSEETSYKNQEGENVYWEFIGLINLEELLADKIQDGTEIRSRLLEVEDPFKLVREKGGLTIFLTERIRNMTADEILTESSDEE